MGPDIRIDMMRERLGVGEEMIGPWDLAELDLDIALMRQFVHELLYRIQRGTALS